MPQALPYDAVLIVSFGGPEGPDEVMPFLERVTQGRNIPRERLLEVAAHYHHFGGVSPLNAQNRALVAARQARLEEKGSWLPVYLGNRHSPPFLRDVVRKMKKDGVRRAIGIATSAFGSPSSCRQYQEAIQAAVQSEGGPSIDKIPPFWDHPGFIEAQVLQVQAYCAAQGIRLTSGALQVLMSAHSIPIAMAKVSPYVEELKEAARLVAQGLGIDAWELVWQSRSGPPQVPWLEPDILAVIHSLPQKGIREVLAIPIGFLSDHMEVMWDLAIEPKGRAEAHGTRLRRPPPLGTHPRFVEVLCELVEERLFGFSPKRVGSLASRPRCTPECCRLSS
ncbi:MAG: ferrochelatase [Deltaproteobacteria bacterium]|nr:ferrochelatase [Deltaproteobacteria bacterium]